MSATQTPKFEQAHAFMVERVYGPAFFEKLAARGFGPHANNPTEVQQLLELGAQLIAAEQEGLYKAAGNDFLSAALAEVAEARQSRLQPQVADDMIKAAADRFVANPAFAQLALAYHSGPPAQA